MGPRSRGQVNRRAIREEACGREEAQPGRSGLREALSEGDVVDDAAGTALRAKGGNIPHLKIQTGESRLYFWVSPSIPQRKERWATAEMSKNKP
jgi:hypothetical protein